MPLSGVSGEELWFAEVQAELKDARFYRRIWTAATVNLGVLTTDLYQLLSHRHGGEVSLKAGLTLVVGGVATLGALTEALDTTMLVGRCKRRVRSAQRDVERMQADRLIQPELELRA